MLHLVRRSYHRYHKKPNSGALIAKKAGQRELKMNHIPETMSQFFDHFLPQETNVQNDIIKTISMPTMLDRKINLKKFDTRGEYFKETTKMIDKDYWLQSNKKDLLIESLKKFDVITDLFKNEQLINYEQVKQALQINPVIRYGNNTKGDNYFDHALFGNYLEAEQVVEAPAKLKLLFADPNKLYTVMLVCPDYPFRVEPEQGQFVHWLMTNVKVQSNGNVVSKDEVVPYLQPLPSEYGGSLRYVYLIFEQQDKVDKVEMPRELQTAIQAQLDKEPSKKKVPKWVKQEKSDLDRKYLEQHSYEKEFFTTLQQEMQTQSKQEDLKVLIQEIYGDKEYVPSSCLKEYEKKNEDFENRRHLDLVQFIQQNKLQENPSGIAFFHSNYDLIVSQKYEQLQVTEPFYIPLEIKNRHLRKKKIVQRQIATTMRTPTLHYQQPHQVYYYEHNYQNKVVANLKTTSTAGSSNLLRFHWN